MEEQRIYPMVVWTDPDAPPWSANGSVSTRQEPTGPLPCDVCPLQRELNELRCSAGYWQSRFRQVKEREAGHLEKIAQLQAEIRILEQRLYGRRTETNHAGAPPLPPSGRRRGQQQNNRGPARRDHSQLPTSHENCELPVEQQQCPQCRQPFVALPETDDGEILEVDVRAHRRRYHRRRYRRT